MAPNIRDTYLAAEVFAAPPQKLQLMLIEGAIRLVHLADQRWKAGNLKAGDEALDQCQEIVIEVVSKLRAGQTPQIALRVAQVYLFVLRSLVVARQQRNFKNLADALKVLESERENWRQICQAMASSREPSAASTIEPSEPEEPLALEA